MKNEWIKSSYCNTSTCVEVMIEENTVAVRDSKNRALPALVYSLDEWQQFVAGVKDGQFDLR